LYRLIFSLIALCLNAQASCETGACDWKGAIDICNLLPTFKLKQIPNPSYALEDVCCNPASDQDKVDYAIIEKAEFDVIIDAGFITRKKLLERRCETLNKTLAAFNYKHEKEPPAS